MNFTYTIFILLLPFFSFLILGLAGKWLSHRTAGIFGTLVLGVVYCPILRPLSTSRPTA